MGTDSENIGDEIERSANILYGLIHARFLITSRGISLLSQKYKNGDFGSCPRVLCENQKFLPIGLDDLPNQNTVKFYCPRCKEIYNHSKTKYSNIDGAYFGRSASHLLELLNKDSFCFVDKSVDRQYVPKIFGFKIHPLAWKKDEDENLYK